MAFSFIRAQMDRDDQKYEEICERNRANGSKVYYGCNIYDTADIGFRDSAFYDFQNNEEKRKEFIVELDRKACLRLYKQYKEIENKTHY